MKERRVLNFKCQVVLLSTLYLLLATSIIGCGYTMRTLLPSKYRNIYIEPFKNKTNITEETPDRQRLRVYYPLLETNITNSLINRFIFDGNLRVARKGYADLILRGELIDYRRDPLRYDDNRNVEEYRINLIVNISLWDAKTEELIWEEKGFIGDITYFTSGTQAKSESSAVSNAVSDLVRRIVERTIEQW